MKNSIIFLSLFTILFLSSLSGTYAEGRHYYNNRHDLDNGRGHNYYRPYRGGHRYYDGYYYRPYGGLYYGLPSVNYSYIETPATVVIKEVEVPTQYIEQADQADNLKDSDYWYYCRKTDAYYPKVATCPGGWMQVIPHKPDNLKPTK